MWQVLSILFLYVGSIGTSWYLTKRFREVCPEYKGKILWTLFFFPIYFILGMIIEALNPFINSDDIYYVSRPTNLDIATSIIVILFGMGSLLFFLKELQLLKIISIENLNQIKKYANLTLLTVVTGFVIAASINFVQIVSSGESFTGVMFIGLIIVGLIWYFTNKKIESLKRLLLGYNPDSIPSYSMMGITNNPISEPSQNLQKKESGKEKLYKLKELLDQGILTQEEFDSMKKDVLKKGI